MKPTRQDLVLELIRVGITRATAEALVQHHDASDIKRRLQYLDWKLRHHSNITDKAAWLVACIKGQWTIPSTATTWYQQYKDHIKS